MEEKLKTVTRVEVIDENGRSYQKFGVSNLQLHFQDNDTTLKVFIQAQEGATYTDWERSQKDSDV
jgi:hypothetical protein